MVMSQEFIPAQRSGARMLMSFSPGIEPDAHDQVCSSLNHGRGECPGMAWCGHWLLGHLDIFKLSH